MSKTDRFCCVICQCIQFCSLQCATTKHNEHHCKQLYFRTFYFQIKYASCFAITSTPTPGVNLDMAYFIDTILRKDKGKGRFCCECDRTFDSVKSKENLALGLAKTGSNGFVAYLACTKPDKCPRNTKYPCGVFYQCENVPKSIWGYVSMEDATTAKRNCYDMQLVFLKEMSKPPLKSTKCVMTKRSPQKGKDGIFEITFVVIAKKGEKRYGYNEKNDKWGTVFYQREWEWKFLDCY